MRKYHQRGKKWYSVDTSNPNKAPVPTFTGKRDFKAISEWVRSNHE